MKFFTAKRRRSLSAPFTVGKIIMIVCSFLIFSCVRYSGNISNTPASAAQPAAKPMAVLQTGGQPLWFMLTEDGPVYIESIEDAVCAAAFVPWPFALHVSFFLERKNELVMAVNREGFIKLAPSTGDIKGIAMYRFSGGDFWKQYTVGGLIYHENNPIALLYLDDRFLDTAFPVPPQRTWTFNMESNTPFPLDIPALELFPAKDGWNVDTLRLGADDLIYYRVSKKNAVQGEIRMFSAADLTLAGEEIPVDIFFYSASFKIEINNSLLPPLPEGFFYTGIGSLGDSLFLCWEEQADFNIGAAGFMVINENYKFNHEMR